MLRITMVNPLKRFLAFLIASFLFFPSLSIAQDSSAGLSGSLSVNHQERFYKDPNKAFLLALFPGLLIHGNGHFYAGDDLMGNVLLTGEVVSVVSIGLGALMKSDPNTFSGGLLGTSTEADNIGSNLIWGGIIAFVGLWVVDMAHSPTAATEYNDRYQLKPSVQLQLDNSKLALAYQF